MKFIIWDRALRWTGRRSARFALRQGSLFEGDSVIGALVMRSAQTSLFAALKWLETPTSKRASTRTNTIQFKTLFKTLKTLKLRVRVLLKKEIHSARLFWICLSSLQRTSGRECVEETPSCLRSFSIKTNLDFAWWAKIAICKFALDSNF